MNLFDMHEQEILEALDTAVRSARAVIDTIVASVDRKLQNNPGDVLAWQPIPLERYSTRLPEVIRSSWVFVLRANVATGAERHPNSQQRMMSYRGGGDFQTQQSGKWCSHQLSSDSAAPLQERWISIPADVWHQGVVGPVDWPSCPSTQSRSTNSSRSDQPRGLAMRRADASTLTRCDHLGLFKEE